jgi:ABC-type sugar transport system permease subunit
MPTKHSKSFLDNFTNFAFLIPALVLFCIFNIYTFLDLFYLSFHKWDGLVGGASKFMGLKNYEAVFQDSSWWSSLRHAGLITLLALTLQNLLALILALCVDSTLRGQTIYKVIFFLPPVLSGIVVGLIWDWIFNGDYGLLNHCLTVLHLDVFTRPWLADPSTAIYAVAFIHMWKGFGWGFVILLAGLQNIDTELYEAAEMDGASWWAKFRYVTVPLMIPVFVIVSILTILGTMQIYDLIVSTTRGGPGYHTEVPITRILHSMHGAQDYGYAAAQGIVFGIILLIVSIAQIKISKKFKQN